MTVSAGWIASFDISDRKKISAPELAAQKVSLHTISTYCVSFDLWVRVELTVWWQNGWKNDEAIGSHWAMPDLPKSFLFSFSESNQSTHNRMFGSTPDEYEIKTELATCCYGLGTVYLAKHRPSQQFVALKKIQLDRAKGESNSIRVSSRDLNSLWYRYRWQFCSVALVTQEEIIMMRQFDFPQILPLHTAFVNNLDVFVVSPVMCFNSCRDAMNTYFSTGKSYSSRSDSILVHFGLCFSGFPEILVCLILRDVLLGIDYLHRKGFIHRSIRASHILINQTKAVLCGFRETTALITHGQRTRRLFDLPPHTTKSLNWLAPEVLEQNLSGYSEKSDIYSIGITTCELANGLEPFSKMPTTFMLTEKMRGNQPALLDCSTCPDEVIGNMRLMWLLQCSS